ncbi:MAG TPA: nucleotidyltransferase [Chloroflexi bacterium]|nr:MAG: nucleotidyltransferase [Chloroflexota bacterium]HDN04759.1 nucleotidyltransferase [Chloroflexota bacterium]
MNIKEIRKYKAQLKKIASKYSIKDIYVFGSVARGETRTGSDVDFLIEMTADASALGVGGFQYDVQQLLGIDVDVVPTFALSREKDEEFVESIEAEAVAL